MPGYEANIVHVARCSTMLSWQGVVLMTIRTAHAHRSQVGSLPLAHNAEYSKIIAESIVMVCCLVIRLWLQLFF